MEGEDGCSERRICIMEREFFVVKGKYIFRGRRTCAIKEGFACCESRFDCHKRQICAVEDEYLSWKAIAITM